MAKEEIKVFTAEMIDTGLLTEHPDNSNKQNRHKHKELKASIRENGFDETLIVCPRDNGDGFYIVAGNHRYRAGKSLGMKQFPCVVRNDWAEVEQGIQLFRRNYIRGETDKDAFTKAVNKLAAEHAIGLDVLQERLGFEDADKFSDFYQKEAEREEKIAAAVTAGGMAGGGASKVKMIDDLGLVLSTIFERFGDTAPYSFLIFPTGGKAHMYVQVTPALKRILETVAQGCVSQQLDMNIVLGGLLAIGMQGSNFKTKEPDNKKVVEAGSEVGDSDLKTMVNDE